MFGISGFELVVIFLFGFLIFGPDKLPAAAKVLGQAIKKFRDAQDEMNKVIKTEVYDSTSEDPFKNPLEALTKAADVITERSAPQKTASFSERKAQYDKERAELRAREARLDREGKQTQHVSQEGAKATPTTTGASSPSTSSAPSASSASSVSSVSSVSSASQARTKPTPDELYGIVPTQKAPSLPQTKGATPSDKDKPAPGGCDAEESASGKEE